MANHTNSKKGKFGTTMGVSSIIAILVILVLIVFSALSITTSKADLTLSEKTADSATNFYNADSVAEEKFAEIAELVAASPAGWQASLEGDEYTISPDDGGSLVEYKVKIDDGKDLVVHLLVKNTGEVSREIWQVVPSKEWTPDKTLTLMK